MINLDKYLKLWQKKRNELQVNTDPVADWAQMQQLLNKHLPAPKPTSGGHLLKGTGFKLIAAAVVSSGVAALVYVGVHHNNHKAKPQKPRYDSVKTIGSTTDSLRIDLADSSNTIANPVDTARWINHTDQSAGRTDDTTITGVNKPSAAMGSAQRQQAATAQVKTQHNYPVNSQFTSGQAITQANQQVSGGGRYRSANGGSFPVSAGNNTGIKTSGAIKSHSVNHTHVRTVTSGIAKGKHGRRDQSLAEQTHGNNRATYDRPQTDVQRQTDNKTAIDVTGSNYADLQTQASGKEDAGTRQPLMAQQTWWQQANAPLAAWKTAALPQGAGSNLLTVSRQSASRTGKIKPQKNLKAKRIKAPGDTTPANIDWGVQIGTSLPGTSGLGDLSPGAFVTFDVRSKWAVNAQLRLLSPQNLSGSYTTANASQKIVAPKTLTVTDARKVYSAQLPVYLEYKATENLRLKAGALISLPIKQSGGSSSIKPDTLRKDSTYFVKLTNALNGTRYQTGFNAGVSAGVALHYNRFILEATYLHQLKGQQVKSDLGSYTSGGNQVQITIGFKLNKPKD